MNLKIGFLAVLLIILLQEKDYVDAQANTAAVIAGLIEAGASLIGTSVSLIKDLRYSVTCSGAIENYTNGIYSDWNVRPSKE